MIVCERRQTRKFKPLAISILFRRLDQSRIGDNRHVGNRYRVRARVSRRIAEREELLHVCVTETGGRRELAPRSEIERLTNSYKPARKGPSGRERPTLELDQVTTEAVIRDSEYDDVDRDSRPRISMAGIARSVLRDV